MKRRSLLAAAGSAAGAFLLDPFGWLGARAVQAPATAELYGFALVRPGEARPRSLPRGSRRAVIPERTPSVSATVRTIDLTNTAAQGVFDGPFAKGKFGQELKLNSLARLEFVTGELVSQTAVFQHMPSGRTSVLTAYVGVPLPYVLLPQGNPRDGYIEFQPATWLPRAGVAIAPAFLATGLWLEDDTLFRLEVVSDALIGPQRTEMALRAVASAITRF
jgi:hypothetical protein